METIEQVNEDFNVKKPKKKGLIIGGIIAAILVVAVVLVYFLVLAKPQFIFNRAIDKIFKVESKSYDSVKLETKVNASIKAEDSSVQQQVAELEKYSLKLGAQMDYEGDKEIIDLGLEYDNDKVVDAQVYHANEEIYMYFDGLFDKYIKLNLEETQRKQIEEIFDVLNSEDKVENNKVITKTIRDELKAQINEEGEFEKGKTTIDVGEKEKSVTKTTLTLSQKELYNVISNMCSNLAENDKFLDCFEKSPKDDLKEIAEEMKSLETNSKNKMSISLYTSGLLNNLLAVDVEIYSSEEAETVTISVVKKDDGLYAYTFSVKTESTKVDAIKGNIEIEKDKDSSDEKSGKATITIEIAETGTLKLEIDYLAEYNKGIDKKDVSNSINMEEITEQDIQSILEKLMERPLIGDLINNLTEDSIFNTDGIDQYYENNEITTSQNEVRDEDDEYSVAYSVPTGFKYEEEYSSNNRKYYSLGDYNSESQIDANIAIRWYSESEYYENIKSDYDNYSTLEYYKNINLSEDKTINVGNKEFKYKILSYEYNTEYYNEKYQKAYIWYKLDDERIFSVQLESTDTEITEDIIKGFLNIDVTKLN